MLVRRLIHGMGYRYRLHVRGLLGKPDVVFPSRKKVVFVHGCFWHGHSCRKGRLPASNTAFWRVKIGRNKARDVKVVEELQRIGWGVLVLWECELDDEERLRERLSRYLDGR